jgi:hypothetical protein
MTRRIGRLIGIGAFATLGLSGAAFAQSDTGINPSDQQQQQNVSPSDINKVGGSDSDIYKSETSKSSESTKSEKKTKSDENAVPGSDVEKKSGSDVDQMKGKSEENKLDEHGAEKEANPPPPPAQPDTNK